MTSATYELRYADRPWRTVAATAALAITALATVATILVANGNPIAAVAPLAAIVSLVALTVASPRTPLLLITLLCLTSDKPGDASGLWQSPLQPIGSLFLDNLNKTVNIPAAKVSLLVILLGSLLLIRLVRAAAGRQIRDAAMPGTAPPLVLGIVISVATAGIFAAYGVATGGDSQMVKIQLQTFLAILAMGYLLATSLHGARDFRAIRAILVAAACVKAAMAVWIRLSVPEFVHGKEIEYATSHGDSMLFAAALVVLLAILFEEPTRRHMRTLLLTTPIIVAGMIANNRRLVWVQLLLPVAIMIVMNRRSRPARLILRSLAYGLPVLLLYVAVGWNASSRVFAPVHTFRTMSDGQVDRSTLFRDIENYNLIYTFGLHPVMGSGFGHPFQEAVKNDNLAAFKEYPYMPHNSILGLWAFVGIGFYGLWMAYIVSVFLAARSFYCTRAPEIRAAAVSAIGFLVIYMLHCWGDIGFSENKGIFLVGLSLGLSGQIAVTTGAWRARQPA